MEETKDLEVIISQLDERIKSLTHSKKEDQIVSRQQLQRTIDEAREVLNGLRKLVADFEAQLAAAEDKVSGGSAAEDDARKEVSAAKAEVESQNAKLEEVQNRLNNLDRPSDHLVQDVDIGSCGIRMV